MAESKFDKTVLDVLECSTVHPTWEISGGKKIDLRKPQSKQDLRKLARNNSLFTVKPTAEEKKAAELEAKKAADAQNKSPDKTGTGK